MSTTTDSFVITDAGLAEVVAAEEGGFAPVLITEVGYGTGKYTPTGDMTALTEEFKRLTTIAGGAVSENVIHLSALDDSSDVYTVYEVGLYTESGTLFAVYSQALPILTKVGRAQAMLAIDLAVSNMSAGSIAFGDTNFLNPPATTETLGVVELATEEEALAGEDDSRAITPKTMKAKFKEYDETVSSGNASRDKQDSWVTRIASHTYAVGDIVDCPFKRNLELICTRGGKTAAGDLTEASLTHGASVTDGAVTWKVRAKIKTINAQETDANGAVKIDVGVKTINGEKPDGDGNYKVDMSGKRDHTESVANADLNKLLEDKTYSCSGTLKNTPISCTFCIVEAFDTGTPVSGNIVQVCYIPQTDNTVRTFTRNCLNGATFGKWTESGAVKTVNGISPDAAGNVSIPNATTSKAGLVRLAAEQDVLNEAPQTAVCTQLIYEINEFRRKSTAYKVGDKVDCAFQYERFLECTKAGTTSKNLLDTRNVTHGQVITDGTVQWTVRTHVRSVNNVVADASGNARIPSFENDGVTVVNAPDYNAITKSGFYHCNSTGAKNGPGYAAKMIVLGEAAAGKHLTQIAFPIHNTTSSIFCPKMRSRNMSGEWEEWKTILLAESDEDVAAKTFTSDAGFVRMTMPNIEKGVAPNATQYAYVGIYDKKGFDGTGNNRVAFFQHAVRSDGSVDTGIFSVDPNSGNVARISVGWTSDGKQISSTSATPSDNSDGSELAPTNWTRMFGGSGYGIGTVAPSVSSRFSSNDLNDINKTGFYTVSGSKNFSPGSQTTIAMHIQRAFDAGVNSAQLSFGTDSRMFIRTRVESTGWEEWAQLMKAKSRNELVNGRYIACHNVTTVKGTAPANVQWTYFALQDSSDSESEANRLAMFAHRQATNNEAIARMACYKPVSGSTESVSISVGYDGSGNSFTSAPNPPDSSNDQNIATTSFVKKTVDAKAGVMTRKGSKGGAGTMTVTGLKTNQLLVVTCDMRNDTWDGGDYALVEADNVVNGWFKTGAGTGFYTAYMIATSSTVNFNITHQGISGSTTTVYAMG